MTSPSLRQCFFSELFGTFCLVFAGTGAVVCNAASGGAVSHLGIALTFGLIVLALIYALGDISGAHLNPAVTVAFAIAKRFPSQKIGVYVLAQILGAIGASLCLRVLFPNVKTLGETVPAGPSSQSFLLEFLLTLILMFVILSVSTGAKEKGTTAGIVVGSVIGLEAAFAGPICGASMNPARSLGPALVNLNFSALWIYLLAPTLGALCAVPLTSLIRGNTNS